MLEAGRSKVGVPAALILLWLCGCAGYAGRIREPRGLYEGGQYDLAAARLSDLVDRDDNDKLLYLLDLGMVYHAARRYGDAVKVFLQAEKLADVKDYTSVTQEVGSVVVNDDLKFYKGEVFEKLLINVYLAMDYTLAGDSENALVECRRVDHKLDMMVAAGMKTYEHNFFATYLAAALFESQGEWNDAFVDYRQLFKWQRDAPYLGVPLLRAADKLKASQEFNDYRKRYPTIKSFRLGKDQGEIIVLVEQGRSPVKVPSPAFRLVPVFSKRSYRSRAIVVRDAKDSSRQAASTPLFDIEETAIRELNANLAAITAKKIGGVVAKEAVGAGVARATNNQLLGALTSFFLHVSDKADLRSWTTLPATLQVARLTLPSGRRDIELDMVDAFGGRNLVARWPAVEIKPSRVTFLNYRTPD